ncbi:transporter substrate-binding domain-containing protein [uncultured Roseobacter sp.]|uniref:substrate-binding periplasmic protein n=1 Tax=uncultured Roseobacter sp. TaxID=114847 RepID=UPI0026366754|nr:transporter substrate-binding domain-containing protein [uncultured Roseobacter sp.]
MIRLRSVPYSLAATMVAFSAQADISLLTGPDNAPFTAATWPEQGIFTELVTAALAASPAPEPHSITWQDNGSSQPDMIKSKAYDMAFPWGQPGCEVTAADDARCTDFHYSEPVIDVVILLFVRAEDEFEFDQDADLAGRTLCWPSGSLTHDPNRFEAQWLPNDTVKLRQPQTLGACFDLLMAGRVDAVAVNEFQGVQHMFAAGLTEKVVPLTRPLATQSLHVVISKTHWRGTALMYRFNAGLAKLKQTGAYAEILSRHIAIYWERLKG